jgi:hypothetical protein
MCKSVLINALALLETMHIFAMLKHNYMKTFLTVAAVLIIGTTAFKPQQEANAIAQKVQGVTTYVNAEPSKPYKVVLRFKSSMVNWVSCPSIADVVNESVKDGVKQAEKKRIDFDAIIITDSEQDLLIKYE